MNRNFKKAIAGLMVIASLCAVPVSGASAATLTPASTKQAAFTLADKNQIASKPSETGLLIFGTNPSEIPYPILIRAKSGRKKIINVSEADLISSMKKQNITSVSMEDFKILSSLEGSDRLEMMFKLYPTIITMHW